MKGPGINDYLRILQQKKQEAHDRGEKWIEISSKELHQEVSPEHATMPTCCQAIYKLLYQGDDILQRPKGQTGFGSHLRVSAEKARPACEERGTEAPRPDDEKQPEYGRPAPDFSGLVK